jgi:hypothetical protein
MRGRRGDFLVVKFLATVVTGAHGVVARGAALLGLFCSYCCSFLPAGGRRRQRWAVWAKRPMG